MAQRSIVINENHGGSGVGRMCLIPPSSDMVLTTSFASPLGVEWKALPDRHANCQTNVTVSGVQCTQMNIVTQWQNAYTRMDGIIQFTQTLPNFIVHLQKTALLRTLQVGDMSGVMLTTSMVLASVIPVCSRPSTNVTFPILVTNQGVKQMGCMMIYMNGTVEIWPTIAKNSGSWIMAPYYIEGFSISWIARNE